MLSLLRHVSGRVLDYGCGYGDLTYAISQTHSVEGVDVDPERVAFASAEYPPLSFAVCPSEGLHLPDDLFDVVVSSVVLPFVPDPVRYLRDARRVLRPGGHLLVVSKNVSHVQNAFRRCLGRGPLKPELWIRTQPEVTELLTAEGFEVIREAYFYDPPVVGYKNLGDWVVGCVEQVLWLLQVKRTCGYFALLARKKQ